MPGTVGKKYRGLASCCCAVLLIKSARALRNGAGSPSPASHTAIALLEADMPHRLERLCPPDFASTLDLYVSTSAALADPAADLIVAPVFKGKPSDQALHTKRQNAVCIAIAQALGLSRSACKASAPLTIVQKIC